MRDKLAYKLVCFTMNWVASKKYQSFINVTSGLGVYTLECELLELNKDQWSDQAKFGEYVYYNWKEFENDV